jgi:predicted ATP-dependent protease
MGEAAMTMDGTREDDWRERAKVPADRARRLFAAGDFGSDATEVPPILGQERAVRAIELGLRMNAHMFLVGPTGTGRTTYAVRRCTEWAKSRPTPDDWCYVANLDRPEQPRPLRLPAGQGRRFRDDIHQFVEAALTLIRQALDSDAYAHHRQAISRRFEDQRQALWAELVHTARLQGFAVQPTPAGSVIAIPLDPSGQPYQPQQFAELPQAIRDAFAERERQLEEPVGQVTRRMRALARDERQALQDDAQHLARETVAPLVEPLRERYGNLPDAIAYVEAIADDLARHVDQVAADDAAPGLAPINWWQRYRVHVLVEHDADAGAPVIVETNPTYDNLLGRIDYQQVDGRLIAGIEGIRPGSLHRANGGYLIIPVVDLLREPAAYPGLKRALRQGWSRIENVVQTLWGMPALFQPEPIPLEVTVLLIGTEEWYYLLFAQDEEFRRLFTVKADFAADMPATPENLAGFRQHMMAAAAREGWLPLGEGAVEELAGHAARMAEDQERLSTRIGEVLAVLAEADTWARSGGAAEVQAGHVRQALSARRDRAAGPEDVMNRLVRDGTLLMQTQGAVVGQINGLAVLSAGDQAFGRPSRITAVTYAGRQGIVAIERQTHRSGATHSKGVLTLAAFFAQRFAHRRPLTLSASLAFEQMYSEIDGDSASCAELYALLSELAGLPIDQGIAVTGSVNQKGEVQPIGGVNQKVEGFYRVCREQGLTGRQGVLIPRRNVRHLMLDAEVVDAIRAGRFHLWAVDHVDEGIQILTGVEAGTPDGPPHSVMAKVAARLAEYAAALAETPEHGGERSET